MRWLLRSDFKSIYYLNATQFLGALNDNLYKLLIVYLLINVEGEANASTILSIAGAIFVIPFLLFSALAGTLADRMSKRRLIVLAKIGELAIMSLAAVAVAYRSAFFCYGLLFALSTQAALFGPSKYGIIPELIDDKHVSKANGLIAAFTYLAIILGTFLASFLTDVTKKKFILVAFFCVAVSALGLLASLGIQKTMQRGVKKRSNPFFLVEIYRSLKEAGKVPHLFISVCGSSVFLFLGGFTQLNIIPFAMQSQHMDEVGGGYLFLPCAVGIAIGAYICGKLSKDRVELGFSSLSAFALGLFFLLLRLFHQFFWPSIVLLFLLGFAAGMFLVPCDAFIQVNSPAEKRGRIIAATNFLSFCGVLFSAGFLYFVSEKLGLSAANGFAVLGILTFLFAFIMIGRCTELFFPFLIRKIWLKLAPVSLPDHVPTGKVLLIFHQKKLFPTLFLYKKIPHLHIFRTGRWLTCFPFIPGWIENVHLFWPRKNIQQTFVHMVQTAEPLIGHTPICFFISKKMEPELDVACRTVLKFTPTKEYLHYRKEKPGRRVLTLSKH